MSKMETNGFQSHTETDFARKQTAPLATQQHRLMRKCIPIMPPTPDSGTGQTPLRVNAVQGMNSPRQSCVTK